MSARFTKLPLVLAVLLQAAMTPAAGQAACSSCAGTPISVGTCGTTDIVQTGNGCNFVNNCQLPSVTGPTFSVLPQGGGVFTVRMVMDLVAPWNQWAKTNNPNGTLTMTWFDVSPAPTPWTSGGDPSLCQWLDSDHVQTYVEKTGLTCAGAPYNFGSYSLRSASCGSPCPPPFFPASCGLLCEQFWTDNNGLAFIVTPQMLACAPPPLKDNCGSDDGACTTCIHLGGPGKGGVGAGGAGGSGGGAGGAGGGAGAAPPGSGPGAALRYAAGGSGGAGFPGTTSWAPVLGRYWSHDYAERIVRDPDDSHVWLITRFATFREFSGLIAGSYTIASPTDEHRKLTRTASGWDLRSLDGTIESFNASGLWTQTVDRNGNAKLATYDSSGLSSVSFPDQRHEVFHYAAPGGKLGSITEMGVGNASSRTWSYTWSGDDLVRIDRPDVTAWKFLYQDSRHPGYLTEMILVGTDGSERIVTAWSYDATGNVNRIWSGDVSADANGVVPGPSAVEVWTLSPDNPTLPVTVQITDPQGTVATHVYGRDTTSSKPKLLSTSGDCPTCGVGPNSRLFYDDGANPLEPTRIIDGRGHETDYTYDSSNGQLLAKTEAVATPLARTISLTYANSSYPAFPTLLSVPSTSGVAATRTLSSGYDASGNLVQVTSQGAEGGSAFSYTTVATFNAAGRPLTIDPPGYGTTDQRTFTYDSTRGNLVELSRTDPLIGTTIFVSDAFNRRVEVIDVNGVEADTSYDALDRTLSVTRRGATPAEDLQTSYSYTVFGDLWRTTLPAGTVTENGYDGTGRLVSIERKPNVSTHGERTLYTLDSFGHRIETDLQHWNGSAWITDSSSSAVYTTRCRPDKIVQPGGAAMEMAYDCNGNLERVWDANHPRASNPTPSLAYTYDARDRQASISQPWPGTGGGNAMTTLGYDVQDHVTSVTDAESNVTTFTYGDRDLVTQQVSNVSGTTTYSYNEHAQESTETDARPITIRRTFDALDRLTLIDYADSKLNVSYLYDAPAVQYSKGRLTSVARGFISTNYAYDRFGRLTQDGSLSFAYDRNGNRSTVSYPNSVVATYGYDFADRPASLQFSDGGSPAQTIVSAATYKPGGPLASLRLGNGLTENRTFDSRYFATSISLGSLFSWTYATDNLANVLTVTDTLNAANNRSFHYLDNLYFLTQGTGPWGSRSWTYDEIGGRLSETRGATTDTYSYVTNTSGGHSPKLASVGSESYSYDGIGDQVQIGSVAFSYDNTRLLRTAGNQILSLSYDGRGLLKTASYLGTSHSNGSSSPTYSSAGLMHHLFTTRHATSGGPAGITTTDNTYFFYFAGRPVATLDKRSVTSMPDSSTLLFLTTDHLDTPVLATNATGGLVWQGGFEPFGRDWNAAPTVLRLPGQWEDPTWSIPPIFSSLRIFYNVNRWYDQARGRYTQPDPLGLDAGPDPFDYANSAPTRFTDPRGLAVMICSRRVNGFIGWFANHSYIWDTRTDTGKKRYCEAFSTADQVEQGPDVDACNPVPHSDGKEDDVFACCENYKNGFGQHIYVPFLNDCQTLIGGALVCAGLFEDDPGVPGGRFQCTRGCTPSYPPSTWIERHR